jgi:uncharacterized protein YdcH (DUF465 family)
MGTEIEYTELKKNTVSIKDETAKELVIKID